MVPVAATRPRLRPARSPRHGRPARRRLMVDPPHERPGPCPTHLASADLQRPLPQPESQPILLQRHPRGARGVGPGRARSAGLPWCGTGPPPVREPRRPAGSHPRAEPPRRRTARQACSRSSTARPGPPAPASASPVVVGQTRAPSGASPSETAGKTEPLAGRPPAHTSPHPTTGTFSWLLIAPHRGRGPLRLQTRCHSEPGMSTVTV